MTNNGYLMTKKILFGFVFSLISICSVSQNNNPKENYIYFVKYLTEHYGLFPYKNINWDSLSNHYSRFITNETSSDSLFFTICRLASHLKDKHLWIDNDKYVYNYSISKVVNTKQVDSIFSSRTIFKNTDLIKSKYLGNQYLSLKTNNILVGKIDPYVGYLSMDWFDNDVHKVDSIVANIIISLSDCNYLIIDIRNNTGGTDSSALAVANHLVKKGNCYLISKIRSGGKADSYMEPIYWKTTIGTVSFNKPILVLINRFSISAAETFSLTLKSQTNIKFMGEPTAGAFSDSEDAYLPNGWHFTYSVGVWTDCKGYLWEEKGIQPDIRLKDIHEKTKNIDPYLEQALKELKK
jgi:carboxyl-terminal processing protease